MKFQYLFAAFAVLAIAIVAVSAGGDDDDEPYVVRTLSVPTSFSTVIYYPACEAEKRDADECDDDLSGRASFTAVILNQGGSVDATYYSQVATKIARQGYIVAVPNAPVVQAGPQRLQLTNTNITLATKLLLQQLSNDASSPLFRRLTPDSFAIIGHSFGGVVALVTAATNGPALCANPANGLTPLCGGFTGFGDGLKVVLTYGTVLVQRRGGVTLTINITSTLTPVILVRGADEGIVARADAITAFNQLTGQPKAFIELAKANHFGITDLQVVPNATVDPSPQTGSQDFSTNKIAKIMVAGLEAHLGSPRNRAFRNIYERRDLKILQTNVTFAVA